MVNWEGLLEEVSPEWGLEGFQQQQMRNNRRKHMVVADSDILRLGGVCRGEAGSARNVGRSLQKRNSRDRSMIVGRVFLIFVSPSSQHGLQGS